MNHLTAPLLAKAPPADTPRAQWPAAVTLRGHLEDVTQTAAALVEVAGPAALRNLGLDPDVWLPRLRITLQTAARLHDLGKANDRFQDMVYGQGDGRQPLRHEAISVWLALHPALGLRDALFPGGPLEGHPERCCAVLAVLGHHVKYCVRGPALQPGVSDPNAAPQLTVLLHHPALPGCLPAGWTLPAQALQTDAETILHGDEGGEHPGLYDLVEELTPFLQATCGYNPRDPHAALSSDWGRFLALVKAWIINADVIGSAAPSRRIPPQDWAREALSRTFTAQAADAILQSSLAGRAPRPFQEEMGASTARVTVAVAGCGSGKTLGAWMWARRHAVGRKLFVCYPTTGTAREGFYDYVDPRVVPADADLVHGRALVDLEELRGYTEPDHDPDEDLARLSGLEMAAARVTVCTVDAALGIMQNHRRGLSGSAALAGAAFIFDEVHAYDPITWSTLLHLLRWLPNAPALLMSATFPDARRDQLAALAPDLRLIHGPEALEALPRYQIERLPPGRAALSQATAAALEAARQGQKVLWVSNTVGRCMERHDELQALTASLPEDQRPRLLVYHSRFRYADRVRRHGEVIDAFQGEGAGVIALTTQVAEMSLDLDADLLLSELAPAAALIQRMGRLHRRAAPGCAPRRCLLAPLAEHNLLPYQPQELEDALRWLEALPGGPLSQRQLAATLEAQQGPREGALRDANAALIAQPTEASRGKLREDGVTASFLLSNDAHEIAARSQDGAYTEARELLIKALIPMTLPPRPWDPTTWRKVQMTWVIPDEAITYDPLRGAQWQRPGAR